MIRDSSLVFGDFLTVALAAGTTLIGNTISLSDPNLADGEGCYLVILARTALATGGSAGTISFALATDEVSAISSSSQVIFNTGKLATSGASIPAGSILAVVRLPEAAPWQYYVGVLAVVTGATLTSGSVSAFLTLDGGSWKPAPASLN
jgi:Bbp16